MIKRILQYPNPSLRKAPERVELYSDVSAECFSDMYDSLQSLPRGAALAANQIGYDVNMFLIRADIAEAHDLPQWIINPEILDIGKYVDVKEEGCLSFMDFKAQVPRHRKIEVLYTDTRGGHKKVKLKNFIARLFQHEIEHLQGKVFIDFMEVK